MIRIAAVGDVHFGTDARGSLAPRFAELSSVADVLLLAGDLTRRGRVEEIEALGEELDAAEVPTVAVLGNHDLESGLQDDVRRVLEQRDVTVLEGDSAVVEVEGGRVGIAGTIGFGGGFPGAVVADFGETEMKGFARRGRETAEALEAALTELHDVDVRVALTHYAPVRDTVVGENPEIYPFLGSYRLADAIDAGGAHIAFHGHAHHGVERGRTPGGVPVRNVALPVIRRAYHVYEVAGSAQVDDASHVATATRVRADG